VAPFAAVAVTPAAVVQTPAAAAPVVASGQFADKEDSRLLRKAELDLDQARTWPV
jgi:hypothetical protein